MAVKTLKEQFEAVLADWAAAAGVSTDESKLNADGEVALTIGESVGTLVYRAETDTVILWFESGAATVPGVGRGALIVNDRFARTNGFTVAYDRKTGRVVVHDRRPAERFTSAAILDAWLEAGRAVSEDVRMVSEYGPGILSKEA